MSHQIHSKLETNLVYTGSVIKIMKTQNKPHEWVDPRKHGEFMIRTLTQGLTLLPYLTVLHSLTLQTLKHYYPMTNNDNLEPLCFQHPPLCLFSKYPALDSHPSHQRSTHRSLWNPTSTVLYVPGLIAQSVIFIHVQCFAISPSFFLNHIPSIYVKIVHFKYEFNACCFETYKSAALIWQPCQNPLNPSHGLAFHSWLTCFSLWEFTVLYKKRVS